MPVLGIDVPMFRCCPLWWCPFFAKKSTSINPEIHETTRASGDKPSQTSNNLHILSICSNNHHKPPITSNNLIEFWALSMFAWASQGSLSAWSIASQTAGSKCDPYSAYPIRPTPAVTEPRMGNRPGWFWSLHDHEIKLAVAAYFQMLVGVSLNL